MPMPSAAPTRVHRAWTDRTLRTSKRMGSSGGWPNWRLRSGRRHTDRSRSDVCSYRRPTANSGRWASRPCGIGSAATFDTNVLGTLLSMKHELRVMLGQGRGSIVNVSSTYGRTGAAGASVYAASKHAVEGLTKSAALEVAGRGVRVNAVAPGPIDTGMLNRFTGTDERKAGLVATVPLHRLGAPEEIAQTIVFLASDKAAFITGASFAADGGKTAA